MTRWLIILTAIAGLMLACSSPCAKHDLTVQDYKALAEQAQLRYEIAKKAAIQRCECYEGHLRTLEIKDIDTLMFDDGGLD